VSRLPWVLLVLCGFAAPLVAQTSGPAQSGGSSGSGTSAQSSGASVGSQTSSPYQGSVVEEKATDTVLPLTLDNAIERGLKHNLGLILSGYSEKSAGAQRLQQLQPLLPTINASVKEAVQQTDLQAEGLRIPGFPAIIGPYGFTDIRASLSLSLINVPSLENYLAARHNFASAKLSVADARDVVVLTVGNAYLLCIADQSRIESVQAQVDTSKVSLDQAVSNHQAGTAPLLDELRARVDYQTQEQSLIATKNQYEKDKIALARAIGLPLEQKFELADKTPYKALDNLDAQTALKQALDTRSDLKALDEQVKAAERSKTAARTERLPSVDFQGDYGDIGVNPSNSHGTGDAVGEAQVPIFEEGKLRGDARQAQAALDQKKAQQSDLRGQVSADVHDAILDIQAAEKQVEVARSNVDLAKEALSEAQQRYAAGVSDNLAVSQAQQTLAQADDQYVSSLYQHNIAKLSLARALGVAEKNYKDYIGGK
jgi:outer membrane protein TolC